MTEVKSLARGLQILDFVWNAAAPVAVGKLAAHLQIDKSSASRLARTLIQHGYLDQASGSRRVIIGRRLVQIGCELEQRLALRQRARPHLQVLAESVGECAHIAIREAKCAVVIEDVEATAALRVFGGSGRRIPLHCTAVGKALLAFGELALPAELPRLTPRTLTCEKRLAADLQEIRRRRFALDDEEHEPGVRCLAVPIFLAERAIAVIGISGPTVRITDDRILGLAQLLRVAAERLSTELNAASALTEVSRTTGE